ncbi:hypothetical protein POJ06DRAFT_255301 [Lipomyces tetrasporus]|uniref:Uncharacterized protein n=1 Tax=Lipomyces tetrasporus TaxID=54092 RepID=A0AAD7QRQ2_9ASCO|nr:uncharacterized protein POJ06DRAFT_255301 [Lipomyces tetrasporus]KAJ8100065.1 hypothetical protein POJ06DRAFT_255301 [Lipomyces tetrasporus]
MSVRRLMSSTMAWLAASAAASASNITSVVVNNANLAANTPTIANNNVLYSINWTNGFVLQTNYTTYYDGAVIATNTTSQPWAVMAAYLSIGLDNLAEVIWYYQSGQGLVDEYLVDKTGVCNAIVSYASDSDADYNTTYGKVLSDANRYTSVYSGRFGNNSVFDALAKVIHSSLRYCSSVQAHTATDMEKRYTATNQIQCHGNHAATYAECTGALSTINYDAWCNSWRCIFTYGECSIVYKETHPAQYIGFNVAKSNAFFICEDCFGNHESRVRASGVVQPTSQYRKTCVCTFKNISSC